MALQCRLRPMAGVTFLQKFQWWIAAPWMYVAGCAIVQMTTRGSSGCRNQLGAYSVPGAYVLSDFKASVVSAVCMNIIGCLLVVTERCAIKRCSRTSSTRTAQHQRDSYHNITAVRVVAAWWCPIFSRPNGECIDLWQTYTHRANVRPLPAAGSCAAQHASLCPSSRTHA